MKIKEIVIVGLSISFFICIYVKIRWDHKNQQERISHHQKQQLKKQLYYQEQQLKKQIYYEKQQQKIRDKDRMDNFYYNEFIGVYKGFMLAATVQPDYLEAHLKNWDISESKIERKMYEDGYSNVDIGILKNKAKRVVFFKPE